MLKTTMAEDDWKRIKALVLESYYDGLLLGLDMAITLKELGDEKRIAELKAEYTEKKNRVRQGDFSLVGA